MSEIVTAVLAVAIAAQVAIMAKAGKNFLNSSLNENMYGKVRGESVQKTGQTNNSYDQAGLKSETEVGYTYDDKNYGDDSYEDDENEEENFEANIGVESSLRLPL